MHPVLNEPIAILPSIAHLTISPMMTLYVKTGCPYCAKVLDAASKIGIEFDLRNIADPAVAQDLIERGGKRQVPYLVNPDSHTEMYESEDIITYLHQKFGQQA